MNTKEYTPNTGLSPGLYTSLIFLPAKPHVIDCQDSLHLPNWSCVTNPTQSMVKIQNHSQGEIKLHLYSTHHYSYENSFF